MARHRCTFRESDIKRMMRAVQRAGASVQRVEVTPDGKMSVIVGNPSGTGDVVETNEWDALHAEDEA